MIAYIKTLTNPAWLAARILERFGMDYTARCEFAAHLFAGFTFAFAGVLWSAWIPAAWVAWTCCDEFGVDGWKGAGKGYDTLWDLGSKLAGPAVYALWRLA